MKTFVAVLCLLFISCVSGRATSPGGKPESRDKGPGPVLTIQVGSQTRNLTRSELLSSPHLKTIKLDADPTYKGRIANYQAIEVSEIFAGLTPQADQTLYFKCTDGFSAPVSVKRLLNTDPAKARAYIAIEDPAHPWPAAKPDQGSASAGPFYLVWEHPERSKIATEEWPFQLSGFEAKDSIEKLYPHVAPGPHALADDQVGRGYRSFLQNCFACHGMNREGAAEIGPDLNVPYNPTEYLGEKFLTMQIRNPQALKHWPQGRMKGFSMAELSDGDVGDIIQYLKYMSRHKIRE